MELSIVYTHENSEMDKHQKATLSKEESQNITHDRKNMLKFLVWGVREKTQYWLSAFVIKSTYQVRKGVSRCFWTWRVALVWESHSQQWYKYLGGTFQPFCEDRKSAEARWKIRENMTLS